MRRGLAALLTSLILASTAAAERWPSVWPDGAGGAGGGITLPFAISGGATDGQCIPAQFIATNAGQACTVYQWVLQSFDLGSTAPKISKIACMLMEAAAGHDAGETVTLTPVWTQFDGAGVVAATDANVTVVFSNGLEEAGDSVTNTTLSAPSAYTGAQALRMRINISGTLTSARVSCKVTVVP